MTIYLFKVAQTVTTWRYIQSGDVATVEEGQLQALDAVIRPNAPNCYGVRATIEDGWSGGIISEPNSVLAQLVHGTNIDGRTEGTIV